MRATVEPEAAPRGAVVSALVAAYSAAYLEIALRSALAQSYREIEVILVDDCPDDSVREVVRDIADDRIRYFRNAANLGTARSYGRALELATGEFAAVLNDDDLWEPTFVETLLDALLECPSASVAFADHWVLTDDTRDEVESDHTSAAWGRSGLAAGLHQPFRRLAVVDRAVSVAIASVFRRQAVIGTPIPVEVGGAYDLYLAYVLSREDRGAVYVDRRLSSWRKHAQNQTNQRSCARAEENAAVMRLIAEDPGFADLRPELSRQYGASLWTVATRNLRYGSDRRALEASALALRSGYGRAILLLGALLVPGSLRRRAFARDRQDAVG